MKPSNWDIQFEPSARKEFQQLDDRVKAEASEAIQDLGEDPFPQGSVELRGHPNVYRIRFYRDAYRIVYGVSEKHRKVIVQRVRPRGSTYRGL